MPRSSETPIDRRLAVRFDESDPSVRFFGRITFFALATSVFAGERLNAFVTAARDFSIVIERQLAAVQGDTFPNSASERSHFNALTAISPD